MIETTEQIKKVGIVGSGPDVETVVELASHNVEPILSEEYTSAQLRDNLDRDVETVSLEELTELPIIFWAAPLRNASDVADAMGGYLTGRHVVVHLSRGFATGNRRITEILEHQSPVRRIGFLTGPLVKNDVRAGRRASGICATAFPEVADLCERILESERFLMYRTPDVVGGELSAAYARMLSFAIGLCTKLDLGRSLEATLFSRGLSEMGRFVDVQRGRRKTAFGLAGCGNLRSQTGKEGNLDYQLGQKMADYEGDSPKAHLENELNGGYELVRLVERIYERVETGGHDSEFHILEGIVNILTDEQTAQQTLDNLFRVPTHFE